MTIRHSILDEADSRVGIKLNKLGYEDFSVLRELLGWGEIINDQNPRIEETFTALSGEN